MRRLRMRSFLLSLALLLAFGMLAGFTLNMPDRGETPQRYYGELIPIIKEKRAELDKLLSKKEKAQVEELKKKMNAIHEEMTELMKSAKAENSEAADRPGGKGFPNLTEEQRSRILDLQWERKKIVSEAFMIADAHKQEVMKLTTDIREKALELRKNRESGQAKNEANQRYRQGKEKNKGPGRHGRIGMNFGSMADPAHFILFDATRMEERFENRKDRRSLKKGN